MDPPNLRSKGMPYKLTAHDSEETIRRLRRENESALVMAQHGFDVEQNPNFEGWQEPSYRIEGKIFENYAPTTSAEIRGIWVTVKNKVMRKKQTRRVIINLDDSNVTLGQLTERFRDWPIRHLEEVVAIKAGKIHGIFPASE